MDLYDVVFEGKILPGKNINTVKAEFATLFKIFSEKKLNSFVAGHCVVLKKALSLERAEELGTINEDVESEPAYELSGADQSVDKISAAIEYAEPGQIDSLSFDAVQIDALEKEGERGAPAISISLADLSVVELEEKQLEDDD